MAGNYSYPWIINRRSDLLWLIGSVLYSIAILGLFWLLTGGITTHVATTVFIFYIAWAFLFDSSHFFATYTRTYFDTSFFRQNRGILLATWCTFLAGPLFIGIPWLFTRDIYLLRNCFTIFNRVCLCLAYFHLVRQHWGIIAIYRRRNNETDEYSRRAEHAILLIGCFLPLLHYQYSQMPMLSSSEIFSAFQPQSWHKELWYVLGWTTLLLLLHLLTRRRWPFLQLHRMAIVCAAIAMFIYLAGLMSVKSLTGWLCTLLFVAFLILIQWYVMRKPTGVRPFNVPKWTLLITVIAAHIIFIELPVPFLLKPVLLGIYHNIQYHRIVYFHNCNKYAGSESGQHGLAAVFTRSLRTLALGILLFGLVSAGFQYGARTIMRGEIANYFIACIAWAIPLHQYILDAVIWQLRKDENLLKYLHC
jgi:hypothetical protein